MDTLPLLPAETLIGHLKDILQTSMHLSLGWAMPPYKRLIDEGTTIQHALWGAPQNSSAQLSGIQPGQLICLYSQMGYTNLLYRTQRTDGLILKLGPFLPAAPTEDYINRIIAQAKLPEHLRQTLTSQYRRLPVLSEAQVLAALKAILSPWGEIVDPTNMMRLNFLRDDPKRVLHDLTAAYDISADWSEQMYRVRDMLLRCVAQGQTAEALRMLADYQPYFGLNTCTTAADLHQRLWALNTLIECALAGTGVHPMYRYRTFLQLQEAISAQTDPAALQRYAAVIVRQYSTLVQNHGSTGRSAMVQTAIHYISTHQSEAVTLADVAQALGKSKSYLTSQFKKETHLTVTQYIHANKMDAAAVLLTTTDETIQAIALRLGISNQGYFTRLFRNHFRVSPQQYRKNHSFL